MIDWFFQWLMAALAGLVVALVILLLVGNIWMVIDWLIAL